MDCGTAGVRPRPGSRRAVHADGDRLLAHSGRRGNQLRLEGAVAASAHVEVVRPDGTTRCQFAGQSNRTCALDTSGTHTVLIEHEDPAQTGGYALLAQRLNDPVGCEWLTVDDAPRAARSRWPAGSTATASTRSGWEHLRIRLTGSGGLSPTAEVVRPDGTRRCAPEVEDLLRLRDRTPPGGARFS